MKAESRIQLSAPDAVQWHGILPANAADILPSFLSFLMTKSGFCYNNDMYSPMSHVSSFFFFLRSPSFFWTSDIYVQQTTVYYDAAKMLLVEVF